MEFPKKEKDKHLGLRIDSELQLQAALYFAV